MSARHSEPGPPRFGQRIQNGDNITAASKAGTYSSASTLADPASASGFWTQILNP
jgi:hypothetical protein